MARLIGARSTCATPSPASPPAASGWVGMSCRSSREKRHNKRVQISRRQPQRQNRNWNTGMHTSVYHHPAGVSSPSARVRHVETSSGRSARSPATIKTAVRITSATSIAHESRDRMACCRAVINAGLVARSISATCRIRRSTSPILGSNTASAEKNSGIASRNRAWVPTLCQNGILGPS